MKPKLFFCILVCVDSINVEISMNADDQCRLYKVKVLLDRTDNCSRHGADNLSCSCKSIKEQS